MVWNWRNRASDHRGVLPRYRRCCFRPRDLAVECDDRTALGRRTPRCVMVVHWKAVSLDWRATERWSLSTREHVRVLVGAQPFAVLEPVNPFPFESHSGTPRADANGEQFALPSHSGSQSVHRQRARAIAGLSGRRNTSSRSRRIPRTQRRLRARDADAALPRFAGHWRRSNATGPWVRRFESHASSHSPRASREPRSG